ncbi:MAG: glycosyltransferase [Cyanobacteria bacterium J06634_6]
MVKVTVLVLRGGGGHYATFRAIRDMLAQAKPDWQVTPLFADSLGESANRSQASQSARHSTGQSASTKFSKVSQTLSSGSDRIYDFMLQNGLSWMHLLTVHIHKLLVLMKHRMDRQLLAQTWQQDPPDLVLSVVPFQNRVLWESLQADFPDVPVVTILTDFADSPPAYWMAPGTDSYVMCPTDKAVAQAIAAGISTKRIIATSGLVIHPQFYRKPVEDKGKKRQALGLDSDAVTGLVMFGANGSKAMLGVARQLERLGDRLQLIFICGRNKSVEEALQELPSIQKRAVQKRAVVGFTEDIPSYMQLADFFIGKPGNVSVSEAVAMNLPTIVERNWLTMTQEKYAADWLEINQIGLSVSSFDQIAGAVAEMIRPENLEQYRQTVAQLENRAVFELPEILTGLLEEKDPAQASFCERLRQAVSP